MITLFATLFVFGVLVLVHEFGHFIAAKIFGIRVERFSVGFPPRAFGKKIGETDYCVSWIPIGGYVKLAGMIDESMDTNVKGEPWEFMSKPIWQRLIVVSAGIIMNFILAVIIFAGINLFMGIHEPKGTTEVGAVSSGNPAEKAGIKEGDIIISINGTQVEKWEEMTKIVHNNPDQVLKVQWKRNEEIISAEIKTIKAKLPIDGDIKEVGIIGISPATIIKDVGLIQALSIGAKQFINFTGLIIITVKNIIVGNESIKESLGGPIAIIKMTGESAKSGFASLLFLTAILSINLAILNILPIPALDGGHFFMLLVEGIIRRPLPVKAKIVIQQIGMALLLALIVFVIYNDLIKLSIFEKVFK
jgi:regulator of sigma E protease